MGQTKTPKYTQFTGWQTETIRREMAAGTDIRKIAKLINEDYRRTYMKAYAMRMQDNFVQAMKTKPSVTPSAVNVAINTAAASTTRLTTIRLIADDTNLSNTEKFTIIGILAGSSSEQRQGKTVSN